MKKILLTMIAAMWLASCGSSRKAAPAVLADLGGSSSQPARQLMKEGTCCFASTARYADYIPDNKAFVKIGNRPLVSLTTGIKYSTAGEKLSGIDTLVTSNSLNDCALEAAFAEMGKREGDLCVTSVDEPSPEEAQSPSDYLVSLDSLALQVTGYADERFATNSGRVDFLAYDSDPQKVSQLDYPRTYSGEIRIHATAVWSIRPSADKGKILKRIRMEKDMHDEYDASYDLAETLDKCARQMGKEFIQGTRKMK